MRRSLLALLPVRLILTGGRAVPGDWLSTWRGRQPRGLYAGLLVASCLSLLLLVRRFAPGETLEATAEPPASVGLAVPQLQSQAGRCSCLWQPAGAQRVPAGPAPHARRCGNVAAILELDDGGGKTFKVRGLKLQLAALAQLPLHPARSWLAALLCPAHSQAPPCPPCTRRCLKRRRRRRAACPPRKRPRTTSSEHRPEARRIGCRAPLPPPDTFPARSSSSHPIPLQVLTLTALFDCIPTPASFPLPSVPLHQQHTHPCCRRRTAPAKWQKTNVAPAYVPWQRLWVPSVTRRAAVE